MTQLFIKNAYLITMNNNRDVYKSGNIFIDSSTFFLYNTYKIHSR